MGTTPAWTPSRHGEAVPRVARPTSRRPGVPRRRRRGARATPWLGIPWALAGLLAGCQAPAPPAPAAAPGPSVEVSVVDFAFQPREIVVRVGQPVTWVLQ